jgi:hypothetical protein
LLNGYLQSLEDAPSIFLKPFRPRRSTHTSYPNELLKNSVLPLREDRPFYPLQRRCQAGVSSAPGLPRLRAPPCPRSAHHTRHTCGVNSPLGPRQPARSSP